MIFVFGSNLAARHGAGAAAYAAKYRGARPGEVSEGLTGTAYALPTKDKRLKPLSLPKVKESISRFLEYAASQPDVRFQVTRVGCGYAGFSDHLIRPLFSNAPENVILPGAWRSTLCPERQFVGVYASQTLTSKAVFLGSLDGYLRSISRNRPEDVVITAIAGTVESGWLEPFVSDAQTYKLQLIDTDFEGSLAERLERQQAFLAWFSGEVVTFDSNKDVFVRDFEGLCVKQKIRCMPFDSARFSSDAKAMGQKSTSMPSKGPAAGSQVDSAAPVFAGIGSRQTPPKVLDRMIELSRLLSRSGFKLRSGGADGADTAFELGAEDKHLAPEVWLPWKGFNQHADTGLYPTDEMMNIASGFHPLWDKLSAGPRKLMARNVAQILGADCQSPVSFVLCWTPDGAETSKARSAATGGTGLAIDLADSHGIPVFNLKNPDAEARLFAHVDRQLKVTAQPKGESPSSSRLGICTPSTQRPLF